MLTAERKRGSATFTSPGLMASAWNDAVQSKRGVIFWRSAMDVLWSVAFGSRRATLSSDASASCVSIRITVEAAAFASASADPASRNTFAMCATYFSRASWKRGSDFK